MTTWPFFSFTRKVVLGRVSTTSPSIWIASSFAIQPSGLKGRELVHKGPAQCNLRADVSASDGVGVGGRAGGSASGTACTPTCSRTRAWNCARGMRRLPRLVEVREGSWQSITAMPVAPAGRHQARQRHLGGVALAAEHGLAEEHAAEAHPVEPANQLPAAPDLDAVGVAAPVQLQRRRPAFPA